MWCVVQINCSPCGNNFMPVPTTMELVRVFKDEAEAARMMTHDRIFPAPREYEGQDVYQLLWNTLEPLNIDRMTNQGRGISNVGMWLPESKRILDSHPEDNIALLPVNKGDTNKLLDIMKGGFAAKVGLPHGAGVRKGSRKKGNMGCTLLPNGTSAPTLAQTQTQTQSNTGLSKTGSTATMSNGHVNVDGGALNMHQYPVVGCENGENTISSSLPFPFFSQYRIYRPWNSY